MCYEGGMVLMAVLELLLEKCLLYYGTRILIFLSNLIMLVILVILNFLMLL